MFPIASGQNFLHNFHIDLTKRDGAVVNFVVRYFVKNTRDLEICGRLWLNIPKLVCGAFEQKPTGVCQFSSRGL